MWPVNVAMCIERNPHVPLYMSVRDYVRENGIDMHPDDLERAVAADELWVVRWHPTTPVGFCCVAARSFVEAMRLATEGACRQ